MPLPSLPFPLPLPRAPNAISDSFVSFAARVFGDVNDQSAGAAALRCDEPGDVEGLAQQGVEEQQRSVGKEVTTPPPFLAPKSALEVRGILRGQQGCFVLIDEIAVIDSGSTDATCERMPCTGPWLCVPAQISTPSGFTQAVQFIGSMQACARYGAS